MRTYKHPKTEEIDLTRVLYALSDPIRIEIVTTLAKQRMATCAELDAGRPKSSMSHHFRALREAGLIRTTPDGTSHINELRRADIDARFPGLLKSILKAATEN